jgi:hypothetical protein
MNSREISSNETLGSLLVELVEVKDRVKIIRHDEEHLDPGHVGRAKAPRSLSTDEEILSTIESAKLHTSLAYSLSTLFFVLMSCKGGRTAVDTRYPIKQEIERVKLYVDKIRRASTPERPDNDVSKDDTRPPVKRMTQISSSVATNKRRREV